MNKKITIISILITLAYLVTLFIMYGFMSSISRYVKELIRDGREIMVIVWLSSLLFTTTYISVKQKKWWALFLFFSGLTLYPIVILSGYYEGFENHDPENVIHVVLVYVSIPLAFTYMIIDGFKYGMKWKAIKPIISFFVFMALALLFEVPKHTTMIEVFALAVIYRYLLLPKTLNNENTEKSLEMAQQ